MIYISNEKFENLHHLYKINLINSCSAYKSAILLGTKSNNYIVNVAVFSTVTHIGSNPPMPGFFSRSRTVLRNTYNNIKTNGFIRLIT